MLKRLFDVVAAAGGLLLLWPVILVTWRLAARDTGASGFFVQERVGRYGRPFRLAKLRTMRTVGGSTVTTRNDARVTPLGRKLRKCKLDELPQLWNVLKGDMSLVGPRPDVPGFADKLSGEDRVILTVRPGITGPATLKYKNEEIILSEIEDPDQYNREVVWPDKVRLNRAYVENWSAMTDLALIWRTLIGSSPSDSLPFTPVVIIGAGRSGTNALRDALTALPGFETWPCDEINPIWRHGNLRHPDDELPPSTARPEVRRFIRRAFVRIWRQQGCPPFVVEKTCANALRVPFVDAVLPEAIFIHIVRDGIDVVASARERWQGKLEVPKLPYFLAKARYAPLSDLPVYAALAIGRRLALRLGRRAHMGVWGPRFAGIQHHAGAPVEEVCARQWAACVERADAAFATMAEDRVIPVSYETLAMDPAGTLARITSFLNHDMPATALVAAADTIHRGGVGKGRGVIDDLDQIMPIVEGPLGRHGYF